MVNYCCLSFGFCTYLCELFSPLWWSHSAQLWKSSAPGVVSRAVIIKMVYLLGTLVSSYIICKFHDWGRCDIAGHTVGVSHYIYKHKKKPGLSIKHIFSRNAETPIVLDSPARNIYFLQVSIQLIYKKV